MTRQGVSAAKPVLREGAVDKAIAVDPEAAMSQLHLSARAFHRVLKLSRTIADLAGSDQIQAAHVVDQS